VLAVALVLSGCGKGRQVAPPDGESRPVAASAAASASVAVAASAVPVAPPVIPFHLAAVSYGDLSLRAVEGAVVFTVPESISIVHEGNVRTFGPVSGTVSPPLCWGSSRDVLGTWPGEVHVELLQRDHAQGSPSENLTSTWVRWKGGRWAPSLPREALPGGGLLDPLSWSGNSVRGFLPTRLPIDARVAAKLTRAFRAECPLDAAPSVRSFASSWAHVAAWVACGEGPPFLRLLDRATLTSRSLVVTGLDPGVRGEIPTRIVSLSPTEVLIAVDEPECDACVGYVRSRLCRVEADGCWLEPLGTLLGGLAATSDGTAYAVFGGPRQAPGPEAGLHRRAKGATRWERVEPKLEGAVPEATDAALVPTDVQASGAELWLQVLARPDHPVGPWPTLLLRSRPGDGRVVKSSTYCP
jgi:hypothetical protein